MTALADSAIAYAQTEGLPVFPLQERGKIPLTSHGLDDATIDAMTIETWWEAWPNANIAIRTGDLIVVDEDIPGALAELAKKHGQDLPATRIARTGKGRHYYFLQPSEQRIRNTAGRLATGIDTRGDGGYVVAPPSVHPDGTVYAWESTAPPAAFPDWMVVLLAKPEPKVVTPFLGRSSPYGQRALEQEHHAVATASEGTRNDRLNTAAFALGQLVAGGELDEHDALSSLEAAARACDLPSSEASATIASGLKAGLAEPRRAPESNGTAPSVREVAPATPARISVEPWQTFNRNSQAEMEFLIDGLWPTKSFAFIASPPKKGKTWLGLAAAISIATGTDFIGHFDVPQPRRVLYLALEGARQAIRARIGSLARGVNLDPDSDVLDNLDIAYRPRGINLADPLWAAEIANIAAEHQYSVIFVDVLRNAARIKENDAAEFSLLRSLLEPALHHCSITLLHHFVKLTELSKERSPAERMSGSGAMYGALDVGIFITGSEDHARRLKIEFDGRDIAMPDPMSVYLEGAGSGPNLSLVYEDKAFWHGDVADVADDDVRAPASAIAHWIRTFRDGQEGMAEVAEHFKITDDTLRSRRGSLERLGIDWQKRPPRGKVYLVDHSYALDGADPPTESPTEPNRDSVPQWLNHAAGATETEGTENERSVGGKTPHLQEEPRTEATEPLRGYLPPAASVPPDVGVADPDDLFND